MYDASLLIDPGRAEDFGYEPTVEFGLINTAMNDLEARARSRKATKIGHPTTKWLVSAIHGSRFQRENSVMERGDTN